MLIEEFVQLVDKTKRERPVWFGLESDPPATASEILIAESQLGLKFPESYRQFVSKYGGGYFALGNLFSVSPESEWNIVGRNPVAEKMGFLAVSDNGVGDLYGFPVNNRICEVEIVFFDHETGLLSGSKFPDLFEFLRQMALVPR